MKIAFNPSTVAALTSPPKNKDITFDLRGRNIFARGVEFKGTDTNTWRDIKVNNVSIGSHTLDLRNGSNTTLTNTNGVVTINSTWRPVVDSLTSDSTTSSLSAKQGKVLKSLIDGKSDSGHNHDDRYLKLIGGTLTGNLVGTSAMFSGRFYGSGDDEGIIIKPSSNGYAGLILGAHDGERSIFYFVKNKPFWRYSYGSDNLDIIHPKKSGTIALTSDIPSSLKNPYALTISLNGTSQGPYDGSAAKSINITPGSIGAATSGHNHDGRYVYNYGGTQMDGASVGKNALGMTTNSGVTGDWWHILQAAWNGEYRWNSQIAFPTQNRNGMYYRSGLDDNTKWGSWVKLLDTNNYSGILDSRYYTEAEVNSLLDAKLNRQNLSYGTWNPRGYNLAADYFYNGGDLSISETGGQIHVSIDGKFWQNEGQYRVLDTSDIAGLQGNLTLHQYLSNTDTTWWPLIWGGSYHNNTSDSTGAVYKSHDKLSWQTSSQTLYATNLYTGQLKTVGNHYYQFNSDATLRIYGSPRDTASERVYLQAGIDNRIDDYDIPSYGGDQRHSIILNPRGGFVGIGDSNPTCRLSVGGDAKITGSIRNLAIGGGIYWNPYVESADDGSDAASITLVKSGVAGGTTLVLSQQNDANDTIQFKTNGSARLYHNSYPILTTQNTYVSNNKGYINGTEITQVNNADKVDNRHAISTIPNTGIIYKAAIYTSSSLTSYWVRLANIPSINQNNEFVATIHVQSGHSNPGRSAILLVYLRGAASSLSKSFKICCNSNYDPNRFRLYYKDSDKTSEIWYQTTGQWDGIITTVISQSSEGSLYEGLTLYSGSITAVQTPSMSTYLSAQVSTITDNISGNASTATKLQTARKIWGQSFDGTRDVNGTIYINNGDSENGAIILNNNINTHARISAIGDQVVFNTGSAIRFGGTEWEYSDWAGLKYDTTANTIYLGIADGTVFNYYEKKRSNGILRLPGITTVTPDSGARIGNSGGDLYLGNSNNAAWVKVQDICSQGSNDNWSIYQSGNAYFKYIKSKGNAEIVGTLKAGQIVREGSGQTWINGRNGALLRETSVAGYHALWSLKTTDGSWDFGEYNAGSDWNNIPVLTYITDSNYNSGNNIPTYQIRFPLASGTVALTSQASSFNVNTAQYLRSLGNQNCQTGRTQAYGDVYTYNTYNGNTGSPTTYTSVIGFGRGIAGTVEIAGGWSNTNLYWRSLRDCCEDWYSWRTVLDSNNYTDFIGSYYWANVKISTTSSTSTSPTVSTLTATSSVRAGSICLERTNEINSSDNLLLNYGSSSNISLCQGGGNVGIGTLTPTQKLDVRGNIITNGFGIQPYYLSKSVLLPTTSPGDGYTYKCLEISATTEISCIMADGAGLMNERGILIKFNQGFDGQVILLKDLSRFGTGNNFFWVQPYGCRIIKADSGDILIGQNQISNTYDDGRSRFFVYASRYYAWIEFLCSNIS